MAAETIRTIRAATNFPAAGAGPACDLKVATGTYTIGAGNLFEADDVVKMCKLPAGAVVVGGVLYGDDIDTGTEALDIDVGWSASADAVVTADPDGFGNFGVLSGDTITELVPVAGIYRPFQGVLLTTGPKLFASPVDIQLDVNTAANATGTGAISVVVYYFMDPNFSLANPSGH